jgi:hypothetical protein
MAEVRSRCSRVATLLNGKRSLAASLGRQTARAAFAVITLLVQRGRALPCLVSGRRRRWQQEAPMPVWSVLAGRSGRGGGRHFSRALFVAFVVCAEASRF